jgi:hypothetical protein
MRGNWGLPALAWTLPIYCADCGKNPRLHRLCVGLLAAVMLIASGCGSGTKTATVTVTEPVTVSESPDLQTEEYSGNGTMTLAPTSYPAGADVQWSCSECWIFFLIALRGPVDNPQLIVSRDSSGTGYIPPGNYTLKVSSSGDWTMNVTPR